jgi:hypothetical protein
MGGRGGGFRGEFRIWTGNTDGMGCVAGGEFYYDEMGYDGYHGGYADDYYGDYEYANDFGDFGCGGRRPNMPVGDSFFGSGLPDNGSR